jgi:glycosyltransferase involved in cell wall biosynthesis
MKNEPLVSIIIPNYNYEKTLPKCLEAVRNQTYKNWEIIFVDDGSTDKSVAIATRFGCKILQNPKNSGGPSAPRNHGIRNAHGEILFFLDSDVALYPDAIENTVAEFAKDGTLGSVCGIYAKTPLFRDSLVEEYRVLQGYYWRLSSVGYVTAGFFSLGAVKRQVIDEIGYFNENLSNTEEVEYGYRLNQKYRLLLTDKVMGEHDDEDSLRKLVKKIKERARQRIPFYFHSRKFMKGFETPQRGLAMVFAGLAFLSLPFSFCYWPVSVLFPGNFLLFMLCDWGQYKFVLKEKGFGFLWFFAGVHWIVTLAAFAGFVSGFWNYFLNPKFRQRYSYDTSA